MTSTPSLLRISAIASTTFIDPYSHSSAIRICADPAFVPGDRLRFKLTCEVLEDELADRVVGGERNRIARIKPKLSPHISYRRRPRSYRRRPRSITTEDLGNAGHF